MLQWTRNIEISEIQGVPKESVEIVERKDCVQGKTRHLCWGGGGQLEIGQPL